MPFVSGFLRVRRRRPGDRPTDPDYGIEEGERPEVSPPDEGDGDLEIGGGPIVPEPPPGVWPPIRPGEGWRPIERPGHPLPPTGLPPTAGQPLPRPPGLPPQVGGGPARPERPTDPDYGIDEGSPPPGTIWPPLPVHDGKFWALCLIGGFPGGPRYRYVVVDASLRPGHPLPRPPIGGGGHPDQGLPGGGDVAQPKPA